MTTDSSETSNNPLVLESSIPLENIEKYEEVYLQ